MFMLDTCKHVLVDDSAGKWKEIIEGINNFISYDIRLCNWKHCNQYCDR